MLAIAFLLPLLVLGFARSDSSTTTDLLWPLPRSAEFGNDVYSLAAANFMFLGTGQGGSSDVLKDAFERYLKLIFETPTPFYPSGAGGVAVKELSSMEVNVLSADETLGLNTNETCECGLGGRGKGVTN